MSGVARGILENLKKKSDFKLKNVGPGIPKNSLKNVGPFGPCIAYIYTNFKTYYKLANWFGVACEITKNYDFDEKLGFKSCERN